MLDALRNSRIDVAPGLFKTPEREEFLTYGPLLVDVYDALFTRSDQAGLTSTSDFSGKRIAVEKSYANEELLAKNHPNATFVKVDSTLSALQAVISNRADLYIGNQIVANYLIKKHLLEGLVLSDFYSQNPSPLYFAAHKDRPELFTILSKGFAKITHKERAAIFERWIGKAAKPDAPGLSLTKEEKNWIKNNPVVTYSEVDWQPMSIIEGGRMTGVMGDYLDLIEEMTGLEFQFVAADSWPDVLEKFKAQEIDMVPGVGNSATEASLGLVTAPYAQFPLVIVGREDASFVNGPEDLEGKTLAIPKYYTSYNYIKENFPNLTVRPTSGIEEALALVSDGKADAFVGHKIVAIYNIEALYLKNLKIIGLTDFNFQHSILVQSADPLLKSIFDKAIAQIDPKTKQRIYDDWIQVSIEESFDYTLLYEGGAAFLVVIALVVFWNGRLRKAVDTKTAEMRQLVQSLEEKVAEVERFNRLAVGRELRISELKQHVNELCTANGKPLPYKVDESDSSIETFIETSHEDASHAEIISLSEYLDVEKLQSLLESYCDSLGHRFGDHRCGRKRACSRALATRLHRFPPNQPDHLCTVHRKRYGAGAQSGGRQGIYDLSLQKRPYRRRVAHHHRRQTCRQCLYRAVSAERTGFGLLHQAGEKRGVRQERISRRHFGSSDFLRKPPAGHSRIPRRVRQVGRLAFGPAKTRP